MTKHGLAGVHITSGPRNGYGDFLYAVGDEPLFIFAVDEGGSLTEAKLYNPDHVTVFRSSVYGDGPHPSQGPANEVAWGWFNLLLPVWLQNPSDYYAPTNEIIPNTIEELEWKSDFTYYLMQYAEQLNLKLCVQGWSYGTPSDDLLEDQTAFSAEDRYATQERAWRRVASGGHLLNLHEYGETTLLKDAGVDLATRYRRVLSWCYSKGIDLRIVIGEAGDYGGYRYPGADAFIVSMSWYMNEVRKDAGVLGPAWWTLGSFQDANIQDGLPRYAEWINWNPAPDSTTPEPPVDEGLIDYLRAGSLIAQINDGIWLNPAAGLQRRIVEDGVGDTWWAVHREKEIDYDGQHYVVQAAEHTLTGERRVYVWQAEKAIWWFV